MDEVFWSEPGFVQIDYIPVASLSPFPLHLETLTLFIGCLSGSEAESIICLSSCFLTSFLSILNFFRCSAFVCQSISLHIATEL